MADEKLQYTLTLATQATGTGAKTTAADLERVAAATEKARAASAGLMSAAEREAAEVERLVRNARALADANRGVAATGNGVERFMARTAESSRVAYGEVYKLDYELSGLGRNMEKQGAQTQSLTSGVTKVGNASRNGAQSLYIFSQGFEDLQYGLRGVLNNIPPLVLAMGGSAGLAGAFSIAAVGANALFRWMTETETKASDVAAKITEVSDNMGSLKTERLAQATDEIEAQASAAEQLRQNFEETSKAEDAYANAVISNGEKIAQSGREINALLGLRVNAQKELKALEDAAEAKRQLAAQQAIEAENRRLLKAREEAANAADVLQRLSQQNDINQADRVASAAKLEALKAQRKELEKIAALQTPLTPGDFGTFVDPNQARNNERATEAAQKLARPELKAEIDGLQQQVDALGETIAEYSRDNTGKLARAAVNLQAAQNRVADIEAAVTLNIDAIQQTLATDTLVAKTASLKDQAQRNAEQLTEMVNQIQPSLETQVRAKDEILRATADGVIASNEMLGVSQSLVTLMTGLQTGTATMNGNVAELIGIAQDVQVKQAGMRAEIDRLAREQQRLGAAASAPQSVR
jgi:hypothetical protein